MESISDKPTRDSSNPSFFDLVKNAEAGPIRRLATNYLIPRNIESSLERHRKIGSPVIRKVIMETVGRLTPKPDSVTYCMNRKPAIESANDFAFKASFFNEAIHTAAIIWLMTKAAPDIAQNAEIVAAGVAVNLGLIAVQRYNRARMIDVVDRKLKTGKRFGEDYKNWTGIDNRAIRKFHERQWVDQSPLVNDSLDLVMETSNPIGQWSEKFASE